MLLQSSFIMGCEVKQDSPHSHSEGGTTPLHKYVFHSGFWKVKSPEEKYLGQTVEGGMLVYSNATLILTE